MTVKHPETFEDVMQAMGVIILSSWDWLQAESGIRIYLSRIAWKGCPHHEAIAVARNVLWPRVRRGEPISTPPTGFTGFNPAQADTSALGRLTLDEPDPDGSLLKPPTYRPHTGPLFGAQLREAADGRLRQQTLDAARTFGQETGRFPRDWAEIADLHSVQPRERSK